MYFWHLVHPVSSTCPGDDEIGGTEAAAVAEVETDIAAEGGGNATQTKHSYVVLAATVQRRTEITK